MIIKTEQKIISQKKSWEYIYCDTTPEYIYKDSQNNHNTNNHTNETLCYFMIILIEIQQPLQHISNSGPVASNHGNLQTTANFLILWNYVVPHTKVNDTEQERRENREQNGGGNRSGRPTGTETDRRRQKGRQALEMRTAGIGRGSRGQQPRQPLDHC